MSIDFEKIRQLVALVESNGLSELRIEEEGLSVSIKCETCADTSVRSIPSHPSAQVAEHLTTADHEAGMPAPAAEDTSDEHLCRIISPMIGVFYRCPSPDSPPFVEVGDHVESGQSIGLIEAMKVFSEVPTEVSGRIVEIPAGNRELVQQGDILVVIDTSDISSTLSDS